MKNKKYNHEIRAIFISFLMFSYMIAQIFIVPYLGINKASAIILLSSLIFVFIIGIQTVVNFILHRDNNKKQYGLFQLKFALILILCSSFISSLFYLFGQ